MVDSTANSIVVEDLTGDLETVQWSGEKAGLCGAAGASAPTNGAPLLITGATATTLTVAGDVETVRWTVEKAELCGAGSSGVASNGSQYIVYAAPFTDPVRGTWQTDPHKGGTRYLWAGYRYQPSQMGFWVDPPGAPTLGVYGASTGTNRLGQYYCWNRLYDINTGRWTTPDPVATPWWNLKDYTDASPIAGADLTGAATDAEKKVALADPAGAIQAVTCAKDAEDAQKAEFPNQAGNQNEVDAYRHCVWQCCIAFGLGLAELLTNCKGNRNRIDKAADKGEARAKVFGDAHEEVGDDPNDKAAQADHDMDRHNNAIGRLIGKMKLKEHGGIPSGCPKEWLGDDGKIDCRKSCRKALDYGDLRVLKLGKGEKVASRPFNSNGKGGPKASGGDGSDGTGGQLK